MRALSTPTLVLALALLAGSLAYSWIFSSRLSVVPAINYEFRDDALITLSHARNLVEYGFIGVSPSGERVEGTSAPLQFWTAAALYAVSPFEFATFFRWQTLIGTALIGALIAGLLFSVRPDRDRWFWYAFGLLAVVASAEILAQSRAFLLWHASGMENVYKNAGLLALLLVLDRMLRTARIHYSAVPLIFAVSITRVDAIVPVAALLAVFAVIWGVRHRPVHRSLGGGGSSRAAVFVLASLVPWAVYMAWRVWYFGDLVPNTGVAQHISIADRLTVAFRTPVAAATDYAGWLTAVGGSLNAIQFVWLPVLLLWLWRSGTAVHRCLLLAAGAAACLAQYALFGPARMDSARTVSELALFAALLVPWAVSGKTDGRRRDALIGGAMIALSLVVAEARPPDRTEIGYAAQHFETAAAEAAKIGAAHDIPRPTLANPDLGLPSWRKQFNMVDFGALGSAIVPRVRNPVRYVAEVAKPDIIEIHNAWSCLYHDLFTNPSFVAEYVAVIAERSPWLQENCAAAPHAMTGYWVRRAVTKDSPSHERKFLDAFRTTLDPELVRAELTRCLKDPGPRPCGDAGRTLFRFVPELKQQGRYEQIAEMLSGDRRLALEYAYFTSSTDPAWREAVLPWADPIPVLLEPSSITILVRAGADTPMKAEVLLGVSAGTPWRIEVPQDAWLDVQPRQGTGPSTVSIVPRGLPAGQEQQVSASVFAGSGMLPSAELRVALRSVAAKPNLAPRGFVDAPPDPVTLGAAPIVFQGWAVDDGGLRRVWVGCVESGGAVKEIGTATRAGERADISALFPDSPDRHNAGWAIRLMPSQICSAGPSTTIQVFAEDLEGTRTLLGTRTVVR